uniref:tRNA (uracil(54)-C(5))-methyltransferase n=1 Tax=Ditylenchus dipsaci TaxID=166011 RepID=A0A915D1H7_9BILA
MHPSAKMAEVELEPRLVNEGNAEVINTGAVEEKEVNSAFRLKIDNLPPFFSSVQVKKFLQKTLPKVPFSRLKHLRGVTYASVKTQEDLNTALEVLSCASIKKFNLDVKQVVDDPAINCHQMKRRLDKANEQDIASDKTPAELLLQSVTPLANMPYEQQLERKSAESKRIATNLLKELHNAGILGAKKRDLDELMGPVLPSPIFKGYRNKCELTVGQGEDGQATVGFICGKMANQEIKIVGVEDCSILTANTREIVREFESFTRQFAGQLDGFDEFRREGFWKMLTIRDFIGDCMMIVTVHPHADLDLIADVKKQLIQRFIRFGEVDAVEFRVTSLYWNTAENSGDQKSYEHLAGAPYIYETLLGTRFRISPSTFFQTNSRGAEVLFTKIGDAMVIESKTEESQPMDAKRPRIEIEVSEVNEKTKPSLVLLDICCGAGTISLCCMKRIKNAVKSGEYNGNFGCIGVEIVPEAIRDAHINCADNGLSPTSCLYFKGEAEFIFKDLVYQMPQGCDLSTSTFIGVLDPPRAGVSDRVVMGCRKLHQMKRLVYVSCDPKAALKNVIDLCRPRSRKYEGEPFNLVRIQPVDMFLKLSIVSGL